MFVLLTRVVFFVKKKETVIHGCDPSWLTGHTSQVSILFMDSVCGVVSSDCVMLNSLSWYQFAI